MSHGRTVRTPCAERRQIHGAAERGFSRLRWLSATSKQAPGLRTAEPAAVPARTTYHTRREPRAYGWRGKGCTFKRQRRTTQEPRAYGLQAKGCPLKRHRRSSGEPRAYGSSAKATQAPGAPSRLTGQARPQRISAHQQSGQRATDRRAQGFTGQRHGHTAQEPAAYGWRAKGCSSQPLGSMPAKPRAQRFQAGGCTLQHPWRSTGKPQAYGLRAIGTH